MLVAAAAVLVGEGLLMSTMRVPPGAGSNVTVTSVSCPRVPLSSSQPQVKTRRRGGSIVR